MTLAPSICCPRPAHHDGGIGRQGRGSWPVRPVAPPCRPDDGRSRVENPVAISRGPCGPSLAALPGSCCRSGTSLLHDEYWHQIGSLLREPTQRVTARRSQVSGLDRYIRPGHKGNQEAADGHRDRLLRARGSYRGHRRGIAPLDPVLEIQLKIQADGFAPGVAAMILASCQVQGAKLSADLGKARPSLPSSDSRWREDDTPYKTSEFARWRLTQAGVEHLERVRNGGNLALSVTPEVVLLNHGESVPGLYPRPEGVHRPNVNPHSPIRHTGQEHQAGRLHPDPAAPARGTGVRRGRQARPGPGLHHRDARPRPGGPADARPVHRRGCPGAGRRGQPAGPGTGPRPVRPRPAGRLGDHHRHRPPLRRGPRAPPGLPGPLRRAAHALARPDQGRQLRRGDPHPRADLPDAGGPPAQDPGPVPGAEQPAAHPRGTRRDGAVPHDLPQPRLPGTPCPTTGSTRASRTGSTASTSAARCPTRPATPWPPACCAPAPA